MFDIQHLNKEIERATARFVDCVTGIWVDAQSRYFLDLRTDPRPWSSPVRAANTNGSILLDRYSFLLRAEMINEVGLEFALALLCIGVTTENSELFRKPR